MITLITGFKLGLQATLSFTEAQSSEAKAKFMRLSGATTQELGPCMKSLVRLWIQLRTMN